MSPVAVKSNLPAKRAKRLRASASARALAYFLYNVGSEVCKASIASLRWLAVPAFTMSARL